MDLKTSLNKLKYHKSSDPNALNDLCTHFSNTALSDKLIA